MTVKEKERESRKLKDLEVRMEKKMLQREKKVRLVPERQSGREKERYSKMEWLRKKGDKGRRREQRVCRAVGI